MASRRRRTRERTRCTAVGRPGPNQFQRFECLDPEEAERLMELGEARAGWGGEYDSEEECEARCNVLLSLPPPAVESVMRQVPVARLAALARVSRAVGAPAAAAIGAERAARDMVLAEYPALRNFRIEDICAQWWLPCVQPYTEMAARFSRRLELPLDKIGAPTSVQQGTRVYDAVNGEELATIDPSFLDRDDAPAVRGLPDARDVPVLLPGESIAITDPSGMIGAPLFVLPRYPFVLRRTEDGLLSVMLVLSGPEVTRAPSRRGNVGAGLRYIVPPPPGMDLEALRVGEGRARRRAIAAYLAHAERVLDLAHGALMVVPGQNNYGTRLSDDQTDIWATLSRTGFPVHELRLVVEP